MSMILMKCPSCGGELEIEDSRNVWFCQFCGSKVILDERSINNNTFHSEVININYNSNPSDEKNQNICPPTFYDCEIFRDPHFTYLKIQVLIDGELLGILKGGESIRQQLSPGEHEICIKTRWVEDFVKKVNICGNTKITIDDVGKWDVKMVLRTETLQI